MTQQLELHTASPLAASDEWWKQAVVYQVYPRSFADSDGDGYGDLRGVIDHLDHLEQLGIDVIWLSPIYRSPQADNGYDICDYRDIDPMFGTLADFDELLDAAHARGIRIVMDLVVNHTSDEHAWFRESRSGLDSPKRDWYIWRRPRDGMEPGEPGAEPNNWGSFFSGPAWELDEATGEYYLHLFHRKQPDLNWENPEVREAVYEMMRWWLDRGVDGFRMDVINFISKVPGLPDGEVADGELFGDGFPFFAFGPRLHAYLQEMHREVFDGRHAFMTVGETPGATIGQAELVTDPARRELDMVFQFEHVDLDHGEGKYHPVPLERGALAASLTTWQEGLAEHGWNSLYLGNHDQPRPVSRFGDDRNHWHDSATALATALHLLRGTPYVYQGEELGMTNAPLHRIDDYRDVEAVNYYAERKALGENLDEALRGMAFISRDNARTPVQWDDGPEAGFTTGTPWIEVNPNKSRINAASQVGVPGSVFEHYRSLIALRHASEVVALGTFERLDAGDPAVFSYRRALGEESVLVLVNLSSDTVVPVWSGGDPLPAAGAPVLTNGAGEGGRALAPWEARVYATPGAVVAPA
ncbi:MAG: alpha-glucosidase [Propionibacterium sp.]|nr:alpha-glucosidase [Propionibacterium sp.]